MQIDFSHQHLLKKDEPVALDATSSLACTGQIPVSKPGLAMVLPIAFDRFDSGTAETMQYRAGQRKGMFHCFVLLIGISKTVY